MGLRVVLNSRIAGLIPSSIERVVAGLSHGRIIYTGRNILTEAYIEGRHVVVKQFSSSLINRLIYTFCKSKGCSSFENAYQLLCQGVDTPIPIAYAESKHWIMARNWYICEYTDHISLYEGLQLYGSDCLDAFAEFVVNLHMKGIRHDDLNNTNVRVCRRGDGKFLFSLIDLNRIKFTPASKPLSLKESFRNVCMFNSYADDYELFAHSYLKYRNLPEDYFASMCGIKCRHDSSYARQRRLKRTLKKIFHRSALRDDY